METPFIKPPATKQELTKSHWSVSEAKARFSEVLDRAQAHPQIIENRGREMAVVLDVTEYRALQARAIDRTSTTRIAEFLRFCNALQSESGAELEIPPRETRPSPFVEEDEF